MEHCERDDMKLGIMNKTICPKGAAVGEHQGAISGSTNLGQCHHLPSIAVTLGTRGVLYGLPKHIFQMLNHKNVFFIFFYLICLRHLIRSTAYTNLFFSSKKSIFCHSGVTIQPMAYFLTHISKCSKRK